MTSAQRMRSSVWVRPGGQGPSAGADQSAPSPSPSLSLSLSLSPVCHSSSATSSKLATAASSVANRPR